MAEGTVVKGTASLDPLDGGWEGTMRVGAGRRGLMDFVAEQPTRIELMANLETARALGSTAPPALLRRADRVVT